MVVVLLQADLFDAVRLPDRDDCLAGIREALEVGTDVKARGSSMRLTSLFCNC